MTPASHKNPSHPGAGVHLRSSAADTDAVDALAQRVGGRVGMAGLLADLNRRARRAHVPGGAADWGFRWNARDQFDQRWWPQGISTSADASTDERVEGRALVAVSWYAKAIGDVRKGSRISFVDLESLRYRHVLLVVPSLDRHGRLWLDGLRVHAGGIVWHGPYVYVAGTRRGLFVARVDDLLRVSDRLRSDDRDRIDTTPNHFATLGYRYLLPVSAVHDAGSDDRVEPMRYSFLSLARSGLRPRLIAGEYGRSAMTTRLLHYALDPDTYELSSGANGLVRPEAEYPDGPRNMQGATVVGDRWYVTRSHGPWGFGTLCTGEPGALTEHRGCLPMGPEDISYWRSTDRLWSHSEWPGRRWVFAIPRTRFD